VRASAAVRHFLNFRKRSTPVYLRCPSLNRQPCQAILTMTTYSGKLQANYLLIFFVAVLIEVEAKQRKDKRHGRNPDVDRYEEVFTIVKNTYLIVLAPVVLRFLYSIMTDPAVPLILKAWRESFRRELTRYIGTTSSICYEELQKTK